MTEPNVLLLDEPTNDFDTQTLSVLEEYLNDFPGVVITVSHDRYFLDRVVNELLIFTDKGKIDSFYGNYSEYLETLQQLESTIKSTSKKPKHEKTKQKKRLSYLEQREWESIEDEITELDEKIISVQKEIDKAGSDIDKVQKLYQEQQQLEHQLELKMNRWEELSLLVEQMKK